MAWVAPGHNGRMHAQQPLVLTPASYPGAVVALCRSDAMLAALVERWGVPPLWRHPRGFAGLTLAILAQQVSLEFAQGTVPQAGCGGTGPGAGRAACAGRRGRARAPAAAARRGPLDR